MPLSISALSALAALMLCGNAAAQLQFFSDMEDADAACFSEKPKTGCKGWMGIHNEAISVVRGEKYHSGRKALKIEFVKNEDYGGTWRKASLRRIFTRFYDYYDEGFDFAAGMKIHRLSAFNATTQINDFDIILQTKADSPDHNYCGLTDAKYLALSYNGGPVDWGSVQVRWTPERKRWYKIETEVWLNTPGLSDGEVRLWVDGRIVAEKTGMDLTGKLDSPINRVMFGGWYSNSSAGRNPCPNPVGPSRRYVDDALISGSYVGAISQVAEGPAGTAPTPISTLTPVPKKPKSTPRNLSAHESNPIPD
ncbi:MAG: polysaccharide lyase [Fibrobacterota bacterium]|nr:polysaccharide lyase [Fibrobacterota bacterium]